MPVEHLKPHALRGILAHPQDHTNGQAHVMHQFTVLKQFLVFFLFLVFFKYLFKILRRIADPSGNLSPFLLCELDYSAPSLSTLMMSVIGTGTGSFS